MPKLFGRNVPPVMLGAMGILTGFLVIQALSPADDTATKSRKPKSQVKKLLNQSDYLNTDYAFQIAPLGEAVQPKDVFRPLVSKNSGDKAANQTVDNFSYSGMAQLNGVANGLLENSQTGQGDFVQEGQSWHDHVVVKVSGDSIELRNANGDLLTLVAGAAATKNGPAAATPAAPAANPVMVGPIGSSDITIQADANAGGNGNQGGGRRRGRRNNGGGG